MEVMPRYLIERVFGSAEQEAMQDIGHRMKRVALDSFPDVTWEHSHLVTDESGIETFCVYEAPSKERLQQHADRVGGHTITRIYEIAGDVTPADFPD
jgi:Protein of unknown function (DUF4242)